jgi:hypothetical protein
MPEHYVQLLISRDKTYTPAPAAVREFLMDVVELGVVPGPPGVMLHVPSGRTREVRDPFTGEFVVRELMDHLRLNTLEQFESAAAGLTDLRVSISGTGQPKLPAIEIDLAESHCDVYVTCVVSSVLRWMCGKFFMKPCDPCDPQSTTGIFQLPETGETIEISEAGAARFWIEFFLDTGYLIPKSTAGNLDLLHPAIVDAARKAFGCDFVQGCYWS